ncbi:MAG: hypothetical protein R3B94_07110 [Hyphomonas sp.]
MTYTILHNPNCSTSRKGLDLLKEAGVEPDVRANMNATERLSVEELKEIAKRWAGFLRASSCGPRMLRQPGSMRTQR